MDFWIHLGCVTLLVLGVSTGVAVDGSSGARHAFVDEAHGHGSVLPGRETVGAGGTIDVRAYGVSVLSWPTVL